MDIKEDAGRLRDEYANFFSGLSTDWQAVLSGLDWCQQLRTAFGGGAIPESVVRIAVSARDALLTDIAKSRDCLEHGTANLDACLGGLQRFLPATHLFVGDIPLAESHFDAGANWVQSRLNRMPELEQWIDFQNLREECDHIGLLSFYETTIHRQPEARQIVLAFRKRFYQLWYDHICDMVPALRQFRGEQHTQLIGQFRLLDRTMIETAPERVRSAVKNRNSGPSLSVGQMGSFKKLLVNRRLRSIRRLLADIPDVLFQFKPCLLMSPLSVSLYLESGAFRFDVVIFDEASQIFIEDALCSLLRAPQVIIAGDTKQLPPTPFFKSLSDDFDEDDESEEEDVLSYESILQAAGLLAESDCGDIMQNIPGIQETRFAEHELTWHYRSRHDSLIAFSKVHFYERIVPFPAPTDVSAVSLLHVPTGIYYPGQGKRNNPIEAGVIVNQVLEYVRANPYHSVGVITFNESQKALIENLLDEKQRHEPELVPLLSEEGSEGFFVKNIENVQGDERDAIFLSVGYARTPAGAISMNFGPLNKDGGERRLNVAITRARIRMTIVTSMSASDIDLAKTNKVGPIRLRGYLEYAQSGGLSLPSVPRTQSEFEHALEQTMRRCGYTTKSNVGRFGHVVGIGIVHPDSPEEYILGVESDGPMYRDAETVRARDRLRDDVLHDLGWRLHRVWSADWIRNPARELAKIEEAIRDAVTNEPEPRQPEAAPVQRELTPAEDTVNGAYQEASPGDSFDGKPASKPTSRPADTLKLDPLLPGMSYYERASVTVRWDRDRFYEGTAFAEKCRTDLIVQLLNSEGSLSYEEVVKRVPEAVGISRVGTRVREIVEAAIEKLVNQGKLEQRSGFLYPAGIERLPARIARNGTQPRPIEQICPEEIGEVAVLLLRASYSMRHDELIVELARLFGFRSTSANMRDHISESISLLELDSRIEVRGGQILAIELN